MTEEFLLPDLGEGLTEAELVQWHVAVGDAVALNQTLAEVETAKAVVELPSPFAGVVRALHVAAGDTIGVGASLVSIETSAGASPRGGPSVSVPVAASPSASSAEAAHGAEASDAPAGADRDARGRRESNLVGYGAPPSEPGHPTRRRRRLPPGPASGSASNDHASNDHAADVQATSDVQTTGDEAAHERIDAPAAPVASQDAERTTRTPIHGVRRQTAEAMVASAFTAPHASAWITLDVTRSVRFLRELRDDPAHGDHHIGPLALAARAACLALARTPSLNARWDAAAGEIVEHHYVHLGIAAATERGLIVPNIKNAERMPLPELADAIGALAATARAGQTEPAALRGGTFTITNIGALGMEGGTPILNPGEAGILATGAVSRRPWEHRGRITLREVMTLTLAFDHRLVDGAQAARFLHDVGGMLREPARAMLMR